MFTFQGIQCQQKGYILRGKITDPSGLAKLSFELEVCRIPNLNVVGIRRKRSVSISVLDSFNFNSASYPDPRPGHFLLLLSF